MKTALSVLLLLLVAASWSVRAEEPEPGVSITVYNSDMALVKDVRPLDIAAGVHDVRFSDVAQRIDPTSVHFKILRGSEASVWEQNYRFDLASSSKILEKYLEKEIDVIGEDADLFTGKLVSFDGGTLVLDQGRGAGPVITLNREKVSYMRFPTLPSGLISKPTLVWKIGAEKAGERLVEVTYMTSSINWHAEYVGIVDEKDEWIDLAAWVSIDNRSGATYENAQLDLVAGDVHRVSERRRMPPHDMAADVQVLAGKAAPEFAEEALFEYYLYKLDTPATVVLGKNVRVLLEFENSEEAGLGRALPAGKVRMYKEDSVGDLQFIGEDRIDHTPKDEDVGLYLGNAFDVVAERTVVDSRKITKRIHEEDYQISVRNHKEEDIVVRVVEHPYGFWTVMRATHEYEKKDANRIEFEVRVGGDGEVVVEYTVRYEH